MTKPSLIPPNSILFFIGWLILLIVHHNQKARYFATFLVVIGGYGAIPLIMFVLSSCIRPSAGSNADLTLLPA